MEKQFIYDKLIKNAKIVAENGVIHGALAIQDGKIAALLAQAAAEGDLPAREILDAKGKYLLPGGVDPHVHIRYPGGKLRETFASGSLAAAAGGCTTIIEHPISTPPQYAPAILRRRIAAAEAESIVDIVFYGAAGFDHIDKIPALAQAGIAAFKTFLHAAPAGREAEFVGLTAKDNFELYQVMRQVAETGLLMAAHTEDNDMVNGGIAALRAAGNIAPIAHCLSRPAITEVLAVERLLTLAATVGARVYLVHISTPQAVEIAKAARAAGQEVYLETCPHYLYLSEEDVKRHGAYCKCNPALRPPEMVEALWKYVENGDIDTIGSDHAPYLIAEKACGKEDIFAAPSGFPGLETRLGYMLKAVREGHISLKRAVELLSTNPAKIFGLYPRKGAIRIGADADLILLDPFLPYTVQSERFYTMARDICRFMDGVELYGPVEMTMVRGKIVFADGEQRVSAGYGRWVDLRQLNGDALLPA